MVGIPSPPDPFDPLTSELPTGTRLVRVFRSGAGRTVATFNPGHGSASRFAFFGAPPVPVLYAAETDTAAVCESILHGVPLVGGRLVPEQYEPMVAGAVRTTRPLRLAALHGLSLRRLGVEASQLTGSPSRTYGQTVAWAAAAHDAGFDGLEWMSRRCHTDRAYVLFGDRVSGDDLDVDRSFARVFAVGPDLDWLIDTCASVKVDVVTRPAG